MRRLLPQVPGLAAWRRRVPIGPVAPVGPVTPLGPVTWIGPVGPVTNMPVAPVGPVTRFVRLGRPVAPVSNMMPGIENCADVAPRMAVGPLAPVAAVAPVGPVA